MKLIIGGKSKEMPEICPTCGLSKDLCVCETIAKESQEITVTVEKKRFGKPYTIIQGIDSKEIDLKDMSKKLKSKFACGGTVKDGRIELQGNHKNKAKDSLVKLGFPAEAIVIK